MDSKHLLAVGLTIGVIAGAIAGVIVSEQRRHKAVEHLTPAIQTEHQSPAASPARMPGDAEARITALEDKIVLLEHHIAQLSETTLRQEQVQPIAVQQLSTLPPGVSFFSGSTNNTDSLVVNLVNAGIDSSIADNIVRRRSEMELKQLELRDKATREGYLRTDRFRDEMNELRNAEVALRDEIGSDYYDRYLYLSGQPNRMGVASVIKGSTAENSGMKPGDLIVDYDGARIFDWQDLNSQTTQGERHEFVNLGVLREGREMTLSVRRGPLGVRLAPTSVDPDNS